MLDILYSVTNVKTNLDKNHTCTQRRNEGLKIEVVDYV